jgi:hypothetical protein
MAQVAEIDIVGLDHSVERFTIYTLQNHIKFVVKQSTYDIHACAGCQVLKRCYDG